MDNKTPKNVLPQNWSETYIRKIVIDEISKSTISIPSVFSRSNILLNDTHVSYHKYEPTHNCDHSESYCQAYSGTPFCNVMPNKDPEKHKNNFVKCCECERTLEIQKLYSMFPGYEYINLAIPIELSKDKTIHFCNDCFKKKAIDLIKKENQ